MLEFQLVGVFVVSLLAALAIVATRRWHESWTGDPHTGGIQKHHVGSPPRVGLVPVGFGLLAACGWLQWGANFSSSQAAAQMLGTLLLCSLPAAGLGLAEDLTKRVGPRTRMAGAAMAAGLAIWLMGAQVSRFDIPGVDTVLALGPVSIVVTVLLVSGFTNAMNIIDGLNGLAGGLALVMLLITAVIANQVGDQTIATLCGVMCAAVLGFLVLNFPRGLMFLGDGGAYLLGFLLVELWILLTVRNPEVTVWIAPVIGFLPTFETIFSIIRRRYIHRRKAAAMAPDRLHLHSLLYRRRAMFLFSGRPNHQRWMPNAVAALALVVMTAAPAAAAILMPSNAAFNALVFALATSGYLWTFGSLTRQKPPSSGSPLSTPDDQSTSAATS